MQLVYGWIAAGFSLVYKVPQMVTLYQVKKVDGLSFWSLACQAASYAFYIAHGIVIDDLPIITMGIISLLQSVFLVGMYCYYYKAEAPPPDGD